MYTHQVEEAIADAARVAAFEKAKRKGERATKKHHYHDWHADEMHAARTENAALLRGVPRQWAGAIAKLKPSGLYGRDGVWLGGVAYRWRDKIAEFAAAHGQALAWDLDDGEICTRARDVAARVDDMLTLWASVSRPEVASFVGPLRPSDAPMSEAEKLDLIAAVCDGLGVDYPSAITGAGAINRAVSEHWWRRVLRRKVARVVEAGAVKLGVVNSRDGGYCSDAALYRRMAQQKRNAAMLDKRVMRNEAGQVYKLSTLAALGTSNPKVRGDELMCRIRGCEDYATQAGHVGTFWTLTAPSAFHAMTVGKEGKKLRPRKNPRYDGVSTPRDAQAWLCDRWALVRSKLARQGIKWYGFRVAEPHHDGTPHWHALIWTRTTEDAATVEKTIRGHWLDFKKEALTDWEQSAATEHRVKCIAMLEGGAAGYMAKYVAKSIGHHDIGEHIDTVDGFAAEIEAGNVKGWQRVDAWAATWGIRQFQAQGQPPVAAWRELRRVSSDQIDGLRRDTGDAITARLAVAVHTTGTKGTPGYLRACFARFAAGMGGMSLRRGDWHLQPAKRVNEVVNTYGETITQKKTVGLVVRPTGKWLISRRQAWVRVVDAAPTSAPESAALAAPWTRFNNCTARLSGRLRAALLGVVSAVNGPVSWTICPPMQGTRALTQGMYG